MVRLTSYSISSTYKCQSTAFVLAEPPAVAGRALWNSICPSFFSCCLSGCFLGIGSLGFSEFWHGARNPYLTVHDRTTFFSSHFRDLQKLKADQKFWVGIVKNDCGQSGHRTLKLTVSQKWADGINGFFACWYKLGKLKVDSMIFGWAWSKMVIAF